MNSHIMLHFIRVYTVCKGKKYLQTKEYNIFENYNQKSLDMYNDYAKFIVSNQKEESISIQRVKTGGKTGYIKKTIFLVQK